MDGVISIGGVVNDDVEIVAALALHHDKLLIPGGVAANVVHKGHVALRGQGLRVRGFHFHVAVVGGGVVALRVGGYGNAAKAHHDGKQRKEAAHDFLIPHSLFPPVRHSLRGRWQCPEYRPRKA